MSNLGPPGAPPPVGQDAPRGPDGGRPHTPAVATSRPPPVKQASVVRYKAALRKAIRRNAREPEIDFLNITAMLDLMTIILVFLLKSMSASSASIPQSKDLTLPSSVITTEAAQDGVVVMISKSQIIVGDDPILTLPGPEQLAQTGVDSKYKRSGANDMYIVPLANALTHARETDKAIRLAKGMDATSSEAIVVADDSTPYRLLIEVLFTLGQSEFGKFHMMVKSGKKR
jgi:biopolymer transport protein ExbD